MDIKFYNGRKVLVTGHTGFKGAWLSRILALAGAQVTGFSLGPVTSPNLYELASVGKSVKALTGDIRDLEAVKKAVRESSAEIVFHMAAQPLVRESYKNPVYTYETNVIGTVNLLEACRGVESIRSVVNVTTDKVYENREWVWGYREHENLCGFDPYSNSKSCSELVTSSYRNAFFHEPSAPAVSTARSGNVIGGGDFSPDRIIPDCVRAASEGKPVVLRNPKAVRPYQHVLECLSGYLLLAEIQYDKKYAGSYNFGPDEKDMIDNETLAALFCDMWGGGLKREHRHDGGPHEAHFLRLDTSKAKSGLGWKPRMGIRQAVELTVEWSKTHLSGGDARAAMDRQINAYFGEKK